MLKKKKKESGASHTLSTQELLMHIFYRWGSILQLNFIPYSLWRFWWPCFFLSWSFFQDSLYTLIHQVISSLRKEKKLILLALSRTWHLSKRMDSASGSLIKVTATPWCQPRCHKHLGPQQILQGQQHLLSSAVWGFVSCTWQIASFVPGKLLYLLTNWHINKQLQKLH